MNQRILLYFLSIVLIFSCSKKADDFVDNTITPEFNIELESSNSYGASFNFSVSSTIENVKLIWNINETLNLTDKIGELDIDQNTSNLIVNNLEQGKIYFFRLKGENNNEIIYSEKIQVIISEVLTIEYKQILNSIDWNNANPISEILELDDGYLFITGSAKIIITKTDNDFNVLWSFIIKDSSQDLFFNGIYSLKESNEYIIFYNGISGLQEDYWGNSYGVNYRVSESKFNDSGEIIWNKDYSTEVVDNIWLRSKDNAISFSKNSKNAKLFIKSDSTYYINNDYYYRELNFDSNGEINASKILNNNNFSFREVLFQDNNEWTNYGIIDGNIAIQKYDMNNELINNYNYGNSGGSEFLSNILDEVENIVILGTNGHENESDGESRWIFNINASSGETTWDIKETEENYSYRGKDLILDTDGNYLSLFFDMYNVHYEGGTCCVSIHDYNFATLIKSDNEGNIIWRFVDGEDFNDDYFEPLKIFQQGNEYIIIGSKKYRASGIWLKRIKFE